MRSFRTAALLALVALCAAVPAPTAGAGAGALAAAGNWAVTLLDPLPERFEAGHSYTIGYWVLQHGSHPYEGDLGRTGLRLVGGDGQELAFEGVALREPAHYAVAVAVPADGSWRVVAMQGPFAEYDVGTLTVPGALAVSKPDASIDVGGHSHDGKEAHWGAIHPPGSVTHGHNHDHAVAPQEAPAAASPQDVRHVAAAPSEPLVPALLGFGAVVLLLGLLLGVRPLRRKLKG